MTIETAKVIVVSQLESMTAFARRLDTGAEVFIPAHLSEKYEIDVGQELVILMVPNTRSESVEWLMLKPASTEPQSGGDKSLAEKFMMSQYQAGLDEEKQRREAELAKWMEEEQEEQVRPLDERIHEFVADSGYTSTGEVAEAMCAQGEDYNIVCLRLQQLHEAGRLSCAQVFRTAFQKKASYRMWATAPDAFLGSENNPPM